MNSRVSSDSLGPFGDKSEGREGRKVEVVVYEIGNPNFFSLQPLVVQVARSAGNYVFLFEACLSW